MQNPGWKSIAEGLGIAAIVASLIFVGLQMRQSQEIAIAETYMSILSSEIAVRNAVSEHADLWKKANSGAELDEAEAVIFGNLVANLTSEANRSMNQLRRLGHTSAARSQVHNFASFLHQNPAARQEWTVQSEIWSKHRALLENFVSEFPGMVLDDLHKLDAISD
jgi:hypothetical protein